MKLDVLIAQCSVLYQFNISQVKSKSASHEYSHRLFKFETPSLPLDGSKLHCNCESIFCSSLFILSAKVFQFYQPLGSHQFLIGVSNILPIPLGSWLLHTIRRYETSVSNQQKLLKQKRKTLEIQFHQVACQAKMSYSAKILGMLFSLQKRSYWQNEHQRNFYQLLKYE